MRVLAARGAHVIGTGRTVEKAKEACASVAGQATPVALELSDFQSAVDCAESVKAMGMPLDIIIANAGISGHRELQVIDGIEQTFRINYLGHFVLVNNLLPVVAAAPAGRIVHLGSAAAYLRVPEGGIDFGSVHSLSKLLCLFDRVQVTLVSPGELRMPGEIVEEMRRSGIDVIESDALEASISHVDIVYSTRIQEERFSSQAEADLYRGRYRLNQAIYTHHCEPNTVIMHPLPRDSRDNARELDDDLNDNPNLAIFRQTDNGMLVRMALFALILDVVDQVDTHARDVNWYTARRF